MEGLGLSAAVSDADSAGYLGYEETIAVQRLRMDYGSTCERLAAEYLHVDGFAPLAKQALRADIRKLEASLDSGRFTAEEAILFDRFATDLDEVIDRLASKSGWKRTLILWFWRTPSIVKALLGVAVVVAVAVLIGRILRQ